MNNVLKYDVIIVGTGIIGMTIAHILGKHRLKIALIANQDSLDLTKEQILFKKDLEQPDRSYTLSRSNYLFLEKEDLMLGMIKLSMQKIKNISVINDENQICLELNSDKDNGGIEFGYMIKESKLIKLISHLIRNNIKNLHQNGAIDFIRSSEIISIDYDNEVAILTYFDICKANIQSISAPLIVGADGRNSIIRTLSGIETKSKLYNQIAFSFDIEHTKELDCTAIEKLSRKLTIAILPRVSPYNSSAVCILENLEAEEFISLSKEEIAQKLQKEFPNELGEVVIESHIQKFHLEKRIPESIISKRMALVGDAAHTLHPIAGLGMNLGIKDIKILSKLILNYYSLCLDIGSNILLENYTKKRKYNNLAVSVITDLLSTISFSNDVDNLFDISISGMKIVNNISKIKSFLVKNIC